MKEILIPLTSEMSEDTFQQLELFRIRFKELWDNWESLKKHGISFSGNFTNEGNCKVSGPGCGIDRHRLKGFYLDFRFFWAKKEPTEYNKISSLIGKYCADKRLYACLASNNLQWSEAGFLHEWHGIKPDDMIDSLFNGELFHSDKNKMERVKYIRSLMNDDLAHNCLTSSVYDRMLVIRNINWIIKPLIMSNQRIRIPIEYANQTV